MLSLLLNKLINVSFRTIIIQVAEIGSHEELMTKNGVYKRLKVALSQEKAETAPSESIESIEMVNRMNEEENKEPLAIDDKDVKIIQKKNASRARLMAKGDASLLVVGSIGAIFSAVVFPGWGVSMSLYLYFGQVCRNVFDRTLTYLFLYHSLLLRI